MDFPATISETIAILGGVAIAGTIVASIAEALDLSILSDIFRADEAPPPSAIPPII